MAKHWDLIESMAVSEAPVHLFTKGADGKLDKSSWGDVNYMDLVVDCWKQICAHSSHQQRCENYVQLTGCFSKTGVGEVRRSCRALMIGVLIRRFNTWALDRYNRKLKKEGKEKVARLHG